MFRQDAIEAGPIINDTLAALLAWAPTRGREGATLRAAINEVRVNAFSLLHDDEIGPPLAQCFALAREVGATFKIIEKVRATAAQANPTLAGAILIRDSLIMFCLETQARIIAETPFVSRQDVEETKALFSAGMDQVQEDLADRMDAMTFRAVIELHAAVGFFLVETARPLPRMLKFQFNLPLPSLAIAQKLYHDAGRADELRQENKIVHPAFCQLRGRALSN